MHIFQCMGKIFCEEFLTKYLTHALKDAIFIQLWNFKSSWTLEVISVFEMPPEVIEQYGNTWHKVVAIAEA